MMLKGNLWLVGLWRLIKFSRLNLILRVRLVSKDCLRSLSLLWESLPLKKSKRTLKLFYLPLRKQSINISNKIKPRKMMLICLQKPHFNKSLIKTQFLIKMIHPNIMKSLKKLVMEALLESFLLRKRMMDLNVLWNSLNLRIKKNVRLLRMN